jgi:formate/nitrite transporter FocA (FNT family)
MHFTLGRPGTTSCDVHVCAAAAGATRLPCEHHRRWGKPRRRTVLALSAKGIRLENESSTLWKSGRNFAGALAVAFMMAFVFTYGFTADPGPVGEKLAGIGVARTLGYASHGVGGWLTILVRGMLCNWMVCTGVVGAMISTHVSGKVIAMWMPILVFFFMTFEHSVVNMFLFPTALILHGKFSIADYFVWNEIPTLLGNMVGGLTFTGAALYSTHLRTAPTRSGTVRAVAPLRQSAGA